MNNAQAAADTPIVHVVDYGLGNVHSVKRAIEVVGGKPELAADAQTILKARHLILPGVGSFNRGMHELRSRDLISPLKEYASSGRPFLGICLGMQLMFDSSEEFGEHDGLGILPGRVEAIPLIGRDNRPHKVPHIGWNTLIKSPRGQDWNNGFLRGLPEATAAYFVHSFTAAPSNLAHRLADCDYNGCLISAAVAAGNLYGCQFHPEKSGPAGLRMMQNFLALGSAS